jgi:glycerol-3-phosphate dehydrogenase
VYSKISDEFSVAGALLGMPPLGSERRIQLNYAIQVMPSVPLQAVFQYYIDVGGNSHIPNAPVLGFRDEGRVLKPVSRQGSSMKSRSQALDSVANQKFDVCVIGGGATGSGCALDSQLRGLRTVLVDAGDFAGGTSSTSTKIVHGGVRYLEEAVKDLDPAQYHVVTRALHERIRMLKNAPYLCRTMEFLLPCFRWTDVAYYDVGLKMYDWVSGEASLFPSHFLSRDETLRRMPGLKHTHLVGSIAYADGQFDDARYNIALVKSFADAGGEALNYSRVVAFEKNSEGHLRAAHVEDQITGKRFVVEATAFVNATGPLSDSVRELATPGVHPRMRPSKGVHILLPLEVMPSADALLIPKTEDGRVLFAVPWMGRLLVGTTENEVSPHEELFVTEAEVKYILHYLNQYLEHPVTADQIVSGIAGARPLVTGGDSRDTKKLARDDEVEFDSKSGLISIMGGKWTTYRAMAEDTINAVQKYLGTEIIESPTRNHQLVGSDGYTPDYPETLVRQYGISNQTARHLAAKFGTGAEEVLDLAGKEPGFAGPVLKGLPAMRAEIAFCAREEMAMTVEDVLFRRLGIQLYSWRSAIHAAPVTASVLAGELGWSAEETRSATQQYVAKMTRYLQLAGLAPEPLPDSQTANPSNAKGR